MGKKARLKKLRKEMQAGPEPMPEPSSFVLSDKTQKIAATIIICALLVFGIALRLGNLEVKGRSPDEGVYMAQASVIATGGIDAIKTLVSEYNSNEEKWIYPSPIRIGYTCILAGVMRLTGLYDERAGSYLSTACSIGVLIMVALIGVRFFNPWITAIALLFISVSPIDLAIARRNWQDTMLAFSCLIVFYACCELTVRTKRRIWYIPFCVFGGYSLLIKESGFIVYGVCAAWLIGVMVFRHKSLVDGLLASVVAIAGVVAGVFVLVALAGGGTAVLDMLRHFKAAAATNEYIIGYQTGPWYRLLEGFWILVPAALLLFPIGVAGALYAGDGAFRTSDARIVAKGAAFFTAAVVLITIIMPYGQNMRYMSVVLAPLYLLGGLGIWYLLSLLRPVLKGVPFAVAITCVIAGLLVSGIRDHRTYERIIAKTGIRDLSIRLLREALHASRKAL